MTKELIITSVLLLSLINTNAQEITFEETTYSDEINLLNSIRQVYRFNSLNPSPYALQIVESGFITKNEEITGTEAEEVFYKLFISIRELAEEDSTTENNYWINSDFYNPRNYSYNIESHELTFQHGTEEKVKSTVIIVTPTSIRLK